MDNVTVLGNRAKPYSLDVVTNTGTGKTTFARIMHRFMFAYGLVCKDNFVEKNGLELKGRFVGQTPHQVKDAFQEAMGGTLFLDEAYALADGGGDSFSHEAVRTLLTEVENNRTNLMVIMVSLCKDAHLPKCPPTT